MAELMSMNEYAAARGFARSAVQRAVLNGVIKLVDGKIDPEQADSSYGALRQAPRGASMADSDTGQQAAKAKVAVSLARLRLLKQRRDTMAEKFLDRSEAIEVAELEATYVLTALRAAPADYVGALAAEMDITPEVARHILERFTSLLLVEVGDLTKQAMRDAERA